MGSIRQTKRSRISSIPLAAMGVAVMSMGVMGCTMPEGTPQTSSSSAQTSSSSGESSSGAMSPCGDGILSPELGEECDDGGMADGDACSSTCKRQRVSSVSAGAWGTCAILNDRDLKCWGRGSEGALGQGNLETIGDSPGEMGANLPPVVVDSDLHAASVVSWEHNCVILEGQFAKCWGSNGFGQLGMGNTSNYGGAPGQLGDKLPSIDFGMAGRAKFIASGGKTTCAVLSNELKCWGRSTDDMGNPTGQLGQGHGLTLGDEPNEMGDNLPVISLVAGGYYTFDVAVGTYHACTRVYGFLVKCWGKGGLLGLGDTNARGDNAGEMGASLPAVDLGTGKSAKMIAAAGLYTCAILSDDTVKCWGDNTTGGLGLGDLNSRGDEPNEMGDNLPVVNLGTGKKAVAIAAHGTQVCVILSDNTVKCWGRNDKGQLGLGDTETRGDQASDMGDNLPTIDLGTDKIAVAISVGQDHACALLNDHSIKCWGGNAEGQLGLGDVNHRGDEPGEMGDMLPTVKLFSDAW